MKISPNLKTTLAKACKMTEDELSVLLFAIKKGPRGPKFRNLYKKTPKVYKHFTYIKKGNSLFLKNLSIPSESDLDEYLNKNNSKLNNKEIKTIHTLTAEFRKLVFLKGKLSYVKKKQNINKKSKREYTTFFASDIKGNNKLLEEINSYCFIFLRENKETELQILKKTVITEDTESSLDKKAKETTTESRPSTSTQEVDKSTEVLKAAKSIVQKFKKIKAADHNADDLNAFKQEVLDYLDRYNSLDASIKEKYKKIGVTCLSIVKYINNQTIEASQEK